MMMAVVLVSAVFPGSSPAMAAIGCGAAANPIVCENALPGTSPTVWDIAGSGDSTIQGFSTDISVNVGTRVDFKVLTPARAYTVDIYRTGWYQGLGARKVATVSPSVALPQTQPACMEDGPTGLYDCGNWAVSASWPVPADAVSGVYVALLTRTDTGGQSHITFVVRNSASRSAVLFQTSDTTWQAYNTYGGSSLYQGGAVGRAYKVSYNRPFATRGGVTARDFYFSAEYPLVRFMERNGYDVSYFSDVDTDRFGSALLNHKIFLSVGHDEYWSGAQRANIEAARDAGVNLQFLTGNEAYWRIRYEPSAVGAVAYRTLVSYKETRSSAKIDPSPQWTGTWRDPRFASQANGAGLPENAVSGTLYQSNFTDLPVTVSAAEGKTRLWRNTSLTSLAAGTTAALAPHTVGYESNEDLDNGFRPAGQIRLSTTVGASPEYLQDFGNTVAAGTTTHHLTMYRADSGALVFSAGSIQWTWGLDQTHDGAGAPADLRMQQAQVNLLADMGAQPATLSSGLIATTASTDTTAPTVTVTSPAAGSSVPNGASVTVSGTAADAGGGVVAGVEVSTDAGVSWHPATGTTAWSYTYLQRGVGAQSIRVRAIDDSLNRPATPVIVGITSTGPYSVFGAQIPSLPDSGDASAVELGLRFTPTQNGFITGVRFYKSLANTGTHTGSLWSSTGVRLATVTFGNESASGWQTATFASAVRVTTGTTYTVSYSAPKGRYAAATYYWSYRGVTSAPLGVAGGFGTAPAGVYSTNGSFPVDSYRQGNYFVDAIFDPTDNSPLVATGQAPLPGSSSVPTNTTISAVLSKDPDPASISFTLVDQLGAAVAGSTSYAAATRTATFAPSTALNGFVTYSVTLKAKDTTGLSLASGGAWAFTTVRPPAADGICPCGLFDDATVPTLLQVSDNAMLTLGVRFSSTVAGTISGVRFYKSAGNTGTHTGTLWTAGGTQLATATFANESTSGWQTVNFGTPVAITPGTDYIASYRSPLGTYSASPGVFSGSGITKGPLSAGANTGSYVYADAFPSSRSSTSYLVDVIFNRTPDPITVVSLTPAAGALDVAPGTVIAAQLSTAVKPGYSLTATSAGAPIAGSTALSGDGTTITLTPTQALPNGATVNVSLSNVVSTLGVTLANQAWSFTIAAAAGQTTSYSLFGSDIPTSLSATGDTSAVELGVSFTPSQAGTVSAIRFFKGAGNNGTHTGSVWSSAGVRLATVTFANETASGWQTAQLSTPLALSAGQSYIVSYLAPQGRYSSTPAYFSQAKTSGPLTAPASGNGRYLYGAAGGFPSYSWNATNYFVDLVYAVTPPPPPPPPLPGVSIFSSTSTPAQLSWADPTSVQLGVRFMASTTGTITGIRYFRGPTDTGAHQGTLWSATGAVLATGTFASATASGWQDLSFATPVPIQAGVEYRASYYATSGTYAIDLSGLAASVTNGSLSTIANGGAYSYSTGFPAQVVGHNYWVDVRFVPTP
ncbi:DUF4082 domain-containing protein [Cryobacterium fucosi]|uniref:DUF4082 domain-containing protein n=1 Tax=Cryobacterium fucosi TaxID=1259157 RepID=A0A4R9BCW8_9MICO|nr:DUF4082 domain-containing protein [Cryobacterium fucosi]TFD79442.1 DUF4082 domain-containing protein [Cryobacterium fucosi]